MVEYTPDSPYDPVFKGIDPEKLKKGLAAGWENHDKEDKREAIGRIIWSTHYYLSENE